MRSAVYADTSVSAGSEGAPVRTGGLACLLLALCTPALAQRSEALSPVYEALVQRYSSGDREGAVTEMSGWPEHRLRDEMTAMRALSREALACHGCTAASLWERVPVQAALMLHSDCAQRARRDGRSAKLHESAATEVANLMRDDPIHRAYARRWYEAMAGLAQGENRWGEAFDWAERGLKAFPDSADLLLVLGSIEETLSAQAASRPSVDRLPEAGTRVTRSRISRVQVTRGHLEKARHAYRSAVAADPSRTDAWLRLGRIAWRLGDTAEARSILENVLARKPDAATAFLAHLFLGRLDEDGGQLDGAARSYDAAIALDSQAQSARLALSHVRLRLGDEGAARREVAAVVEGAGRRPQPDPFWRYPWGPSAGVEDRLEALRREACS
jgi:tetratricopeptide (TPR) repeat protein